LRKKKKNERKYKGGKNKKTGKRRRKIYFLKKITYMGLVQIVHSQNFQTPVQPPENIDSF